jgi:hypothetical protein
MFSGLVKFNIALLLPIMLGSNLIFTEISTPFLLSEAGACAFGCSILNHVEFSPAISSHLIA